MQKARRSGAADQSDTRTGFACGCRGPQSSQLLGQMPDDTTEVCLLDCVLRIVELVRTLPGLKRSRGPIQQPLTTMRVSGTGAMVAELAVAYPVY